MDFTDAVANVFAWFDGKLSVDPGFISVVKFPTHGSFLAYLRQATWNAARLTERERKRHQHIESLPDGPGIIVRQVQPEELSLLLEAVDSLDEPHKTIFHRYFVDEENLDMLASTYGLSEQQIYDIYTEAVDILAERLT
jgi:DNA-directed RNA polymerase specialized sigma24 family protein